MPVVLRVWPNLTMTSQRAPPMGHGKGGQVLAEMKSGQKKKTGVERGTTDELEVMQLIITSNQGLMARVLDKIRQARNISNMRSSGAFPAPAQQAAGAQGTATNDQDD